MTLREQQLAQIDGGDFDALIVGGGINGSVAAAALSAHGQRVAVVDRGDFASETSQESSNLVWGGFKYLQNYEVRLVRKLCKSRNRLMAAYPSRVVERRFVAALGQTSPYSPTYATVGTHAYWALGGFGTRRPARLSNTKLQEREPIVDTSLTRGGIEYSDAYLPDSDARFCFGFIRSALDSGNATAANYVEVIAAEKGSASWRILLRDTLTGTEYVATSSVLINAAGPHSDDLNEAWDVPSDHRILYSKGVHLVVDQLSASGRILAFFDDTGRLFYVIPMGDRSVIGTTDTRVEAPDVSVTEDDRTFLLGQLNQRLRLDSPLTEGSIIAERCGVRPLVVGHGAVGHEAQDWTALSRKHEIEVNHRRAAVTIFGGKLTDCLNVGDEVVRACGELGLDVQRVHNRWYGEPAAEVRQQFFRRAGGLGLDQTSAAARLWRRFGDRAFGILDSIEADPHMACHAIDGSDVSWAEVAHIADHEMVVTFDDFLRRRTDLSLTIRNDELRTGDGILGTARMLFGDDGESQYVNRFAPETDNDPESEPARR